MVAPSPTVPDPAAQGRRRRLRLRRSGVLLLGAALVMWLAGRGLGLIGSGPPDQDEPPAGNATTTVAMPDPGPDAADSPSEQASQADSQAADFLTAGAQTAGTQGETPATAVPSVAGSTPAAPAGESQEGDSRGQVAAAPPAGGQLPVAADQSEPTVAPPLAPPFVDADRFHSLCSIVELRLSQGELGDAAASLANLRAQHLAPDQQATSDALLRRLAAAKQEVASALHGSLQRGEVLAARTLAERWFAAAAGAADAAAGDAVELPPPLQGAFGADVDWRRALQVSDTAPPQPAPLDRRRRVRLDWRGELVVGSVAQARADQVTVRVETAHGQSYPTVPAVACEPLDGDADEAIEMSLVAVAAGEPLLARLWWARALVLGVDAAAPRPARLRQLLR